MARCKPNDFLVSFNVCARLCSKQNDPPIAKFVYEEFILTEDSTFFDGVPLSSLHQFQWQIFVNNRIIYNFGYGNRGVVIPELSNGSTYDQLNLGLQNIDIFTFINTLPNTSLTPNLPVKIRLNVKDVTGVANIQESNLYLSST